MSKKNINVKMYNYRNESCCDHGKFRKLLISNDIVNEYLEKLEEKTVRLPIFAAHSLADKVTLFEGIEETTSAIEGEHTIFKIDEEFDLCHADLPISSAQLIGLDFDKSQVNENEY